MFAHTDHRREVREQHQILRYGSVAQRRQLLRMRTLPPPDDLEAVAVTGTAVLDLPEQHTATTATSPFSPHVGRSGTDIFDPLQHLVTRYGGDSAGYRDSDAACLDYSTFVEVLCPNGTSLLENLPISPTVSLQHVCQPDDACHDAEASASTVSSSSSDTATPPGIHADEHYLVTPQTHPVSAPSPPLSSTEPPAFVDAPISLHDPLNVCTPAAATTSSPAQPGESGVDHSNNSNGGTEEDSRPRTPQIFVSGGSLTLTPSHHSARRHRRSKHAAAAASRISPASRRDSLQRSFGSADRLSCNDHTSGLASPAEASGQELTPTSALHTPLPPHRTTHDLAGRVLLTDRLVESQRHTALPTMVEAYRQYVQATTAVGSSSHRTSSAAQSAGRGRRGKLSEKEELAAVQRALAPRQHGIVLETDNADAEVARCVAAAMDCTRPSFRYIDPAELYGAGSYHSGTFIQKK